MCRNITTLESSLSAYQSTHVPPFFAVTVNSSTRSRRLSPHIPYTLNGTWRASHWDMSTSTLSISLPIVKHAEKLWAIVAHNIQGRVVFVTLVRQGEQSVTIEMDYQLVAEFLRSDRGWRFTSEPLVSMFGGQHSIEDDAQSPMPLVLHEDRKVRDRSLNKKASLPVFGKAWEQEGEERAYFLEFEGLEYTIADNGSQGWKVLVCGADLCWKHWVTYTDALTLDESQAAFWNMPQQAAAAARRFAASRTR